MRRNVRDAACLLYTSTAVDEKNIILVKELKVNEGYEDMEKVAKMILDMLSTEAMATVHIAYGTIVNEVKEVSRSYKEAKMALDVGKIFFSEKNIVAYNNLGIGRLIYQLPVSLCRMFIKEIFDGKSPDEMCIRDSPGAVYRRGGASYF